MPHSVRPARNVERAAGPGEEKESDKSQGERSHDTAVEPPIEPVPRALDSRRGHCDGGAGRGQPNLFDHESWTAELINQLDSTEDPTVYDPLAINNGGQISSYPSYLTTIDGTAYGSGAFVVYDQTSGGAHLQESGQEPLLVLPPGANSSWARGVSSTGDMVGFSDSKTMNNFVYSYASNSFPNLNLSNLQPATPSPGPYYLFGGQSFVALFSITVSTPTTRSSAPLLRQPGYLRP